MRALRAALFKAWNAIDPSRIVRRFADAATVLATAAVVLLASFVAVALSLA